MGCLEKDIGAFHSEKTRRTTPFTAARWNAMRCARTHAGLAGAKPAAGTLIDGRTYEYGEGRFGAEYWTLAGYRGWRRHRNRNRCVPRQEEESMGFRAQGCQQNQRPLRRPGRHYQ